MTIRSRAAQRGTSLLEALLSFVLLATGTLAVAALQGQMRLHADVARQRAEAVRLGQRELERMRTFSVMNDTPATPDAHAYASIADADSVVDRGTGYASNTSYRIARRIDAAGIAGARSASVAVAWADRSGAVQRIVLDSVVAGLDPSYTASLALGIGSAAGRGSFDRSALVPLGAHALGNGRSVWKPVATGIVAYVFDDVTGAVVARCSVAADAASSALEAADLHACDSGRRVLVTGAVRFTSSVPPNAAVARDAPPDLTVSMPSSSGDPPGECGSASMKTVRHVGAGSVHIDAVPVAAGPASVGAVAWDDTGDRFVAYRCLVVPRADGRWSGRIAFAPVGWSIGNGLADRRVCRYVDAGAGHVATLDAGGRFSDIGGGPDAGTSTQNFLIVGGGQDCP